MSDTFSCINDSTGGTTRGKERKHRLISHVKSLDFETFEPNCKNLSETLNKRHLHVLNEFFANFAWVFGRLRHHELVLLLIDQHVVGEQIFNDLSNVVESLTPVDVATLDRMVQLKKRLFIECLLADEPVFLV